jgi:hypothetical protein
VQAKDGGAVKELPILFKGELVRAILAGTKTQTRRLCGPANEGTNTAASVHPDGAGWGWIAWWGANIDAGETKRRYPNAEGFSPPHGRPGDRLWVRETWGDADHYYQGHANDCPSVVAYRADRQAIQFDAAKPTPVPESDIDSWNWDKMKWRPSIYMPRWASRIDLEITEVRVQRLQDITEEDARAEGIIGEKEYRDRAGEADLFPCPSCNGFQVHPALGASLGITEVDCKECETIVKRLSVLWDAINSARTTWASNPWVWAYTFRRIRP